MSRVRTLAAVIFMFWRLGWMATAMYVPSLAVNAATGGQVDMNTMTIIVGVVVTIYTMLGGIQAVIWNDVIQFCIMFGGLAATVAIAWSACLAASARSGHRGRGAGKLDAVAAARSIRRRAAWWRRSASFFQQPMNVITLLVALVVGRMAQYTSDQVMVQRLQTTRSVKDARQAFIVNAAGDALWMIGLSFVGFALFAYFQRTRCRRSSRPTSCCRISCRGVSGRRGWPRDCRDHGGVAVEHRLGDQLLHIGRGRRFLQPFVEGPRCASSERSAAGDREQVLASRARDRVLRRARHDPGLQRLARSDRCSKSMPRS